MSSPAGSPQDRGRGLAASIPRLSAIFLLAATVAVYMQVAYFPIYVFDDTAQIVNNEAVHHWSAVPSYFTQDVWQHGAPATRFYRPLFQLWLLLNYKLFGLHAMGWHMALLLLHALAVLLLWRVLLALEIPAMAAFFTSLLFGMHPVHVESVAWLSGSVDPLMAAFFLGGMLAYLKGSKSVSGGWLALSSVLALASMWTKEVGLALPVLMVLHELFLAPDSGENRKRRVWVWLAAAAPVIVYALSRANAVHTTVAQSWATVARTAPMLAWFYVRQSFWPVQLSIWYDVDVVPKLTLAAFWIPCGLAILSGVAIAIGLRRRSLAAYMGAFWWSTIGISIVGVRVFGNFDIAHDRYNYLSVAALAFLVVTALGVIPALHKRQIHWLVASVLALLLAVATVRQVNTWGSDRALYLRGIEVAPRNPQPRLLLVSELLKRGQMREAIELAVHTVELDPKRWDTNFGLGVALWTAGQLDASEQVLRRCIQLDPRRSLAYVLLAKELSGASPDQALGVLRSAPPDVDDPKLIAHAIGQLQPADTGSGR